jgi:hypothetical protein
MTTLKKMLKLTVYFNAIKGEIVKKLGENGWNWLRFEN